MDLIPLVASLAVTGFIILFVRISRASMRRQIGADAQELRLHRPWATRTQRVLVVVALCLPAATVIALANADEFSGSFFPELFRSFWMLAVAYGIGESGTLMIGTNGFRHAAQPMIAWSDLIDFAWDRDIGQQQWGFTATIRRGRRTERLRLFVDRRLREQLDTMLARHFQPAATRAAHSSPTTT